MRFFTTAGPVDPKDHYYVPHRFNEVKLQQLIEQKKYFVVHAPRQSGKTTAMRILVDQLNVTGKYKAFYINFESAQANRNNMVEGLRTILVRFRAGITNDYPEDHQAIQYLTQQADNPLLSGSTLYEFLQLWSKNSSKPIILFIDEIDSLVGDTLITVLRQLRDGYINRSSSFPQSVCLIGVRDVRDYRIWSETENNMILGGSAFNIKAESLTIPNFSLDQIRMLYLQHSHDTGQQFTDEAIEYVFYLTQGQPWLVNALAYQACFVDVVDRTQSITKEVFDRSKEALILRRDTHFAQLTQKLKEPCVKNFIDIAIGKRPALGNFSREDLAYVREIGLIAQTGLKIANPIYQELVQQCFFTGSPFEM